MRETSCSLTVSLLLEHLEKGTALTAEAESHLQRCSNCSSIVQRAGRLGRLLEDGEPGPAVTTPTGVVQAAESEVAVTRRRNLAWRIIAALVVTTVISLLWVHVKPESGLEFATLGVLLLLYALPVTVFVLFIRAMIARPRKVYKRLAGRELSGVGRGISEVSDIPVWVVRMAFVPLGAWGFMLYVVLSLLLPVHPEDRVHLLRFKVARWWRRTVLHGAR
jgi:phage shock protein PspC (stress-responsive transcriptional regulator)